MGLFDEAKPKPKTRKRPPPAKPCDLPVNWSDAFYPPAREDIALRKRVLGW